MNLNIDDLPVACDRHTDGPIADCPWCILLRQVRGHLEARHEAGRIADQTLGLRPMTSGDWAKRLRTFRLNRPFEPRRFGEHDR